MPHVRSSLLALASALVSILPAQSTAVRSVEARITSQPPDGLKPATNLSAEDRRDNFEALWKAVDATYAHFELKSIDWNLVGRRYRTLLGEVTSDGDFYRLLFRMIGEMKDTHSWLQNYAQPVLADVTSVAVDLFEDRPFIVAVAPGSEAERAGVSPGWEVTSVDGLTVAERMEALRPLLAGRSSERAFRREAARRVLASENRMPVTVVLRLPGGETRTITLPREPGRPVRRPAMTSPPNLTRTADLHFGVLPSGAGYIRILSFASREQLDREFDAALEGLRNTRALILDIRDNTGGFGHPSIVGRFLQRRTQTTIAFVKNGPGHGALGKRAGYDGPTGQWQYTGRVALLVNDATGSASDLFATELRSAGRVTIVGSTTHGNLSGTAAYAVLPCNLVVRISNGYVADAKGRPVEVNGNAPDIPVEPTIADFCSGRDPVLDRAVSLLSDKTPPVASR